MARLNRASLMFLLIGFLACADGFAGIFGAAPSLQLWNQRGMDPFSPFQGAGENSAPVERREPKAEDHLEALWRDLQHTLETHKYKVETPTTEAPESDWQNILNQLIALHEQPEPSSQSIGAHASSSAHAQWSSNQFKPSQTSDAERLKKEIRALFEKHGRPEPKDERSKLFFHLAEASNGPSQVKMHYQGEEPNELSHDDVEALMRQLLEHLDVEDSDSGSRYHIGVRGHVKVGVGAATEAPKGRNMPELVDALKSLFMKYIEGARAPATTTPKPDFSLEDIASLLYHIYHQYQAQTTEATTPAPDKSEIILQLIQLLKGDESEEEDSQDYVYQQTSEDYEPAPRPAPENVPDEGLNFFTFHQPSPSNIAQDTEVKFSKLFHSLRGIISHLNHTLHLAFKPSVKSPLKMINANLVGLVSALNKTLGFHSSVAEWPSFRPLTSPLGFLIKDLKGLFGRFVPFQSHTFTPPPRKEAKRTLYRLMFKLNHTLSVHSKVKTFEQQAIEVHHFFQLIKQLNLTLIVYENEPPEQEEEEEDTAFETLAKLLFQLLLHFKDVEEIEEEEEPARNVDLELIFSKLSSTFSSFSIGHHEYEDTSDKSDEFLELVNELKDTLSGYQLEQEEEDQDDTELTNIDEIMKGVEDLISSSSGGSGSGGSEAAADANSQAAGGAGSAAASSAAQALTGGQGAKASSASKVHASGPNSKAHAKSSSRVKQTAGGHEASASSIAKALGGGSRAHAQSHAQSSIKSSGGAPDSSSIVLSDLTKALEDRANGVSG